MSVSVQPVVRRAVSTGPASGASIEAVAPVAGSWTSTPKLSLRQGNRWVWADILGFPIVNMRMSRRTWRPVARQGHARQANKSTSRNGTCLGPLGSSAFASTDATRRGVMIGLGHVLRRRRSARLLRPAARHRGAPFHRARHPGALDGYAWATRARGRLCHALSRAVSRGGGALPRLHAGGAGRGEMAFRQADADRAGRRIRTAARRFLGRSRTARARARDVA